MSLRPSSHGVFLGPSLCSYEGLVPFFRHLKNWKIHERINGSLEPVESVEVICLQRYSTSDQRLSRHCLNISSPRRLTTTQASPWSCSELVHLTNLVLSAFIFISFNLYNQPIWETETQRLSNIKFTSGKMSFPQFSPSYLLHVPILFHPSPP